MSALDLNNTKQEKSQSPLSSNASILSIPIENCIKKLSIDAHTNCTDTSLFLESKQKFIDNLGIDIGGTLAKYTYYNTQTEMVEFGFKETDDIEGLVLIIKDIIKSRKEQNPSESFWIKNIMATGGGAHKFYDILNTNFSDLNIHKKDEMKSLIFGLNFFINLKQDEIFTYSDTQGKSYLNKNSEKKDDEEIMLVNIGSGVSMLKLNMSNLQYERVGGSSLGGGTLWGLLTLITGISDYDEMLRLAGNGDNSNVDMLVGDIYGTAYDAIGLKSTAIASSMAKIYKKPETDFSYGDISKSLLYTVSNNIGQISYLQAKIHNVSKIFFAGSYIRGHLMTMHTLDYAINFWSKNEKSAFFIEHESYLGAMGALISE
jgi:type II pantothenate kinase